MSKRIIRETPAPPVVVASAADPIANLKLAPPASPKAIESLVARISRLFKVDPSRVPADYLDFLRRGNGGSGDLAEGIWIRFEGAGEVIKNTKDYCFHEVGLLLIGGDGFGNGYGINFRTDPPEYVVAGYVDINPVYLGTTFAQFIESVIAGERPLRPGEQLAKPAAKGEIGQVAQWKWKGMGPAIPPASAPWLMVTPDGKHILAADRNQGLTELDLLTGAAVRTYQGLDAHFTQGRSCRCGAISDDGKLAAAGWVESFSTGASSRAVATIHDCATGATLRSIDLGQSRRIEIHDLVFTPGGRELLAHTVEIDTPAPDGTFATKAQVRYFNVADGSLARAVPVVSNPCNLCEVSYDRPAALSPDGRFLAVPFTKSSPAHVVIYDATDGRQVAIIPGGLFGDARWSPDSKRLAVAAGWVTLYDAADFRPVLTLSHLGQRARVAFTPDGTRLVTSDGCGLCVHRLADGRLLAGWPTPAGTMVLGPDGTTAVTADGQSKMLRIWRLPEADAPEHRFSIPAPTGASEHLAALPAHSNRIWAVIVAQGGAAALTASLGGQVMLWDTSSLSAGQWLVRRRWQLSLPESGQDASSANLDATPIYLANDGSLALVQLDRLNDMAKEGAVVALDPENGRELGRMHFLRPYMFTGFRPPWPGAVAPDKSVWLARDGKILRWAIACGGKVSPVPPLAGPGVVRTPRDSAGEGTGGTTCDGAGGSEEQDPRPAFASDLSPTVVAVSPDGRLLAAGGPTGVELFEIASGNRLASLPLKAAPPVLALAFAPDGRTLAVGLSGGVVLFELDGTFKPAHTIALPPRKATTAYKPPVLGIHNLTFSDDSRWILCTDNAFGNQFVTLIDVATGKKAQKFRPKLECILTTAFGPDFQHVVIAGNTWGITSRITIWSITDGQCVSKLDSPDIVGHQDGRGPLAAVGTTGLWLVAGDTEGALDVWRLAL